MFLKKSIEKETKKLMEDFLRKQLAQYLKEAKNEAEIWLEETKEKGPSLESQQLHLQYINYSLKEAARTAILLEERGKMKRKDVDAIYTARFELREIVSHTPKVGEVYLPLHIEGIERVNEILYKLVEKFAYKENKEKLRKIFLVFLPIVISSFLFFFFSQQITGFFLKPDFTITIGYTPLILSFIVLVLIAILLFKLK